jgi:hypothetical protein
MIPTAEEFVNNNFTKQIISEDIYASKSGIIESHILFARIHVKAALDAANAEVPHHCSQEVLNAYPPENIT